MRLSIWAAAGACAAVAVLATAGCSAGQVRAHPSLAGCRSYGVHAIDRRMTVRTIPQACAGLSRSQVNQAVDSAIHAAVGSLPKAAARRLAVADGRYLAPMVRAVPPSAPEPLATGSGGAASPAPGLLLPLAALACWLVTAIAGAYLLVRSRMPRGLRKRAVRSRDRLPAVMTGHAALAVTGLAVWIGFASTGETWLAWLAVGLVMTVAGLGMATLIGGLPEPESIRAAAAKTAGSRAPVPVIAAHGIVATVTILVVLLAAIAAS
jgi:manganese efflux pump family protein